MIARRHRTASMLTLLIAMPFAAVQACGPDWEPDTFVRSANPDDLKAFAEGKLGILQAGYDSRELAIAYRYLNGGRLSEKERLAYLPAPSVVRDWRKMTSEQIEAARKAEDEARPVNKWLAARAKYLPKDAPDAAKEALPEIYGKADFYYDPGERRCGDAALETAALTLNKRAATWGNERQWLVDWIRAQDAVFSNCEGKNGTLPMRAPEGSPALLQADRAYQEAAAAFYAGRFDDARARFETIASDRDSPWRWIGGYLAARAVVRKAFAMEPKTDPWSGELAGYDMKTMQDAQAMLEALAKVHDPMLSRKTIEAELNFVRIRTEPDKRIAEICAALEGPGTDANFGQDLNDLNYVLLKHIEIKNEPLLLEWIRAFRGGAEAQSALAWRESHALPWLVVAVMNAGTRSDFTQEMLDAAAQIKPGEPAYDTVTFHRIRLLTALGRTDEARALLDEILPGVSRDGASSRRNAFLGERMAVARTFDEFLKFAPRTVLEIRSAGAGSMSWDCSGDTEMNRAGGRCEQEGRAQRLDEAAALILNRQTPLALLVDAASSPNLPENLQQGIVLAAWTRSVVLEDAASAAKLAPRLPEQVRKTAGNGIGFPAVLALLRNPGLRPYLEPGISHLVTFNNLDHYRSNWWCEDWQGQFARDPWTDSGIRKDAAIFSKEQEGAADAEYGKMRQLPCAPVYLGRRVIDYAKTNPTDADVPEALALTVKATRYACLEWGGNSGAPADNNAVSKSAFQILHSKYPKSPWTAKTRYYY